MPLWILFFTALTLALHSVPAEAPEPEPSVPVEVVLTEPVFRAETGLPMYPDYTLDKDLLVWAEEYEASTGTPVVMYDLRTVLEGADQLEAWVTAFEAGEPAELLLLGSSHGLASNRYTFLLYDGGDSYTCLDAHAGTSLTETAVWKNRVGWVIAGVVPMIREPVSPDLQYQQDEPCDPSVRDHLLALDPESPYQEQVLREVTACPGSINGLPCQSYSLNYERGNTVYLETLDGGLVIRNDGMYWNQVILDQEAVLLRPGQEPEPTPHCPDLPGALPFSSESAD